MLPHPIGMGIFDGSGCYRKLIVFVFVLIFTLDHVSSELTPPYFNLATGRKIYATATCGVDTDGPELYCKLVGANTENDNHFYSVIQGQVCDTCDPTRPDKSHPPENAIDGKETWWQSPPLSRGNKYNEVNLTIDFGQEFHVAYIFIRMGNSPRPGLWTLEKSTDYGKTWTPWQHFSDTEADCEIYFSRDSLKPITRDDDVICTTEFSKIVPLENGEIPIMLLNNRPSANNYFHSPVLQEWTRATNVRIRLFRTKNLLGHLMSVARQDPTVTRRYFYSIKDISIGGRCMCNGYADTCDIDPKKTGNSRVLVCACHNNTCGVQCSECCPGFEQKKWRQNTNERPFQCEPCNCFGHSHHCIYDEEVDREHKSLDIHGNYEGGGVCQNCQHNTEGINCNKCKAKFFRPWNKRWNETDVCQPCDCDYQSYTGNCEEGTGRCECRIEFQPPDCKQCAVGYFDYPNCRECDCNLNGTEGYHCEARDGTCPCKYNFAGPRCKECADGFYNYPECKPCECSRIGSVSNDCDFQTGKCKCLTGFGGDQCERCEHGYHGYPNCKYCGCDIHGTESEICNKDNGTCLCRLGYGGKLCEQCLAGYYNYPDCIPCNCSMIGSISKACDANGRCSCLTNFAGKQCTACKSGYYSYPECLPCNCDVHGSQGISCNSEGKCSCEYNFDGKNCEKCKEGFYNFPACEECNCDPAGVIPRFAGCGSVPAGELCQCKDRVTGRICNQCKPLYWNLTISNPDGCELCDCNLDGTVGSLDTCHTKNGQCACKPSVEGRRCTQCKDGTFDLFGSNLFGCKDCGCDIGGSRNPYCNKRTGQCNCHPRIAGRTCSHALTTHYYPTLYQFQFEYEDGYTPGGKAVRYQFDDLAFSDFSGKGYAVFSDIQNEVINEVNIFKSSVYRMVIRYVNPTGENITAKIVITSDNPNEVDQHAKVLFRPSDRPQFVTVSGSRGEIPSHIVLDPGRYSISIQSNKNVYLDYFVLLPAAYYEASILTRKIENPCEVGRNGLCRHFQYPNLLEFKPSVQSFITEDNKPTKTREFYTDEAHLTALAESEPIPLITNSQRMLNYLIDVKETGQYVIVIDYITDRRHAETYYVSVRFKNDKDKDFGTAVLYPCLYTMVCRQPVIDSDSREKIFYIDLLEYDDAIQVYHEFEDYGQVAIKSVTAIPYEQWSVDFINPSSVCVMDQGECVKTTYGTVPDSKKIEFEIDNAALVPHSLPTNTYSNATKLIYLDRENATVSIKSKVTSPGSYVILLKYYQPDHPKFKITFKLSAGKQNYEGQIYVHHCPSNTGCQAVVRPASGYQVFDIENDFTFNLTNKNYHGVYFDHFFIVPADLYSDRLLQEEEFDQTKKFIQECGQNHFHIQLNASDFCKKAVFSLTADYNDGALPCTCDYEGSNSFECDPFGGQCQCKPNVIGRQCDQCRTGFYGFPDCKHCDCPLSALCEKDTGECICPPRVVGDKCDQCQPFTYGFHQVIGCEECNCNPLGVERGNLQCDLHNGSCSCRRNIEGRTCDTCVDGFFNFPHCEPCRCLAAGTTFEICDKVDETCLCKPNVVGQACDMCAEGTYNLQASNPEGCTKCFCFGKTTRCQSAFLRVFNVSMLENATINTVLFGDNEIEFVPWVVKPEDIMLNETTLQVDIHDDEGIVYFGVIQHLLNQRNHLTAYGGYLVYTLYYTTGPFGGALLQPDIILQSNSTLLFHTNYEQPANAKLFRGTVQLVESNFRNENGEAVSRAEFMTMLRDLTTIHIRATYWEKTIVTYLSDVYLTIADEDEHNRHLYQELPVEDCNCPPGYTGLSCEECAPGYYRDPDGLYGGYCIPCQCNGHSETCDCLTGICHNCTHFTTGDHCEQCIEGYHGVATNGYPDDCMICACPLPYDSNNFATSCEIADSGLKIRCECKPGYIGERCQSCAPGFYGVPEKFGDFCKPCECSGNINPNEPDACDTVTGECLQCLNNTYGTACNLCAPGYYGDAVKLKDCKSCDCEQLGTAHCDSYVGTCTCHENVIGDRCDRCEEDHYGYDSGLGCKPCECDIASYDTQCDSHTGACQCKPGVTGRRCDHCAVDFWNYTEDGCTPCMCNKGYSRGFGCNAKTGQCECLPGVIGEKCDACPRRWVLIKDVGCAECDVCHHALLNVTDDLYYELDPVYNEFQTIGLSYFTARKLAHYDNLVKELVPKVKSLDPTNINFDPVFGDIEDLQKLTKTFAKNILNSHENAEANTVKAEKLLTAAEDLLNNSRSVSDEVKDTIREVEQLSKSFDTSGSTILDNAINKAGEILDELSKYEIDIAASTAQLNKANDLFTNMELFSEPVDDQKKQLDELKKNFIVFHSKLDDLRNMSAIALNNSNEVFAFNGRNKIAFANSKFDTVENQTREAQNNIDEANDLIINGKLTVDAIAQSINKLMATHDKLGDTNEKVDVALPLVEQNLEDIKPLLNQATDHATNLTNLAEALARQYANIEYNSERAVRGATAYTNIIDAVKDAKASVDEAKSAAKNATDLGRGVIERSEGTNRNASDLLFKAQRALSFVQNDLHPHVNRSAESVLAIGALTKETDEKLKGLAIALEPIPDEPNTDVWTIATEIANEAQKEAKLAADLSRPITATIADDLEKTRKVTKDIDAANKEKSQTESQLNHIDEMAPTLNSLLQEVTERQEKASAAGEELRRSIENLKNQIEAARTAANSIKVGVGFDVDSLIELKPPESAPLLATNTRISMFFNTTSENGFLFFLGNENKSGPAGSRRGRGDDFIALEIENGYPILRLNLGNDPEKLIVEKYVANGEWYQAVVDRSGKNVTFSILEELDGGDIKPHRVEKTLEGKYLVFDVDKDSKLFVGGYPPDFNMPKEVISSSFQGEMEGLKAGDEEMGLWNFIDAQEINRGALPRNKIVLQEKQANGYRFNGNGYVSLDARGFNFKKRASILFRFKTAPETTDGLIFYAGKQNDFISVQMKDTNIHFHYKMADYYADLITEASLNDNEWHTVEATRDGPTSLLKIDGQAVYKEEQTHSADEILHISDEMYFGGFPGHTNHTEIVTKNFDGCIADVLVSGQEVDLSRNLKAIGVRQGCPDKYSTSLSFASDQIGYLKTSNITTVDDFHVILRVKTKQKDGIVFYATNNDQSSSVSLTFVDGSIVFSNMGASISTGWKKYNDGEWHSITASRENFMLKMVIDDFEEQRTKSILPELHIKHGDIFFGGLPANYRLKKNSLPTVAYFVGCISDVAINGKMINFAESKDKSSANIDGCPASIFDYDANAASIYFVGDVVDVPVGTDTPLKLDDRFGGNTESPIFRVTPKTPLTHPPEKTTRIYEVFTTPPLREEYDQPTTIVPTSPPKRPEAPTTKKTGRKNKYVPTQQPECVLPLDPNYPNGSWSAGNLFGLDVNSRVEYQESLRKTKRSFDIGLQFKTNVTHGILFFAVDTRNSDFIAIYLEDGYVHYAFQSGKVLERMKSNLNHADGQWHRVVFNREVFNREERAHLVIDDEDQAYVEFREARNVPQTPVIFLGGSDPSYITEANQNFNYNETRYFAGCIKDFWINDIGVQLEPRNQIGVLPCAPDNEPGVFFGKEGGFLKLYETFRVGAETIISFDIKPRTTTALLMSVFGRSSYMIIELIDGVVKLSVKNSGADEIVVTFSDPDINFCDGKWRTIEAIKSQYVISLSIDGVATQPSIGSTLSSNAATTRPLFFGGHPHLTKIKNIKARRPYHGCMRNFKVRKNLETITPDMGNGNTFVGVCPVV